MTVALPASLDPEVEPAAADALYRAAAEGRAVEL